MPEELSAEMSVTFKQLEEVLKNISEPEKKLENVIHFMETMLAQAGTPHFKDFWDAKKLCMELFKENIPPSARLHLWAKYSELSREAKKLKEIFDEQSAFNVEQIEMAIASLETDAAKKEELLELYPEFVFSHENPILQGHIDEYKKYQRELNFLNVYCTKVNTLRKELMKTEMRIRDKNKFFERLSKLGDTFFPRRKELIGLVSTIFIADIEQFIATTFNHDSATPELFHVRDAIKAFQSAAKELTLNTETFSLTRNRLSECWDGISKVLEERKRHEIEQRSEYREHRDAMLAALETLKKKYDAKEIDEHEAIEELDAISSRMRKTTLGKQEIALLKEKIFEVRSVFAEKQEQEAKVRREELHQREIKRLEMVQALHAKIEAAIASFDSVELEDLEALYKEVAKEIASMTMHKAEKMEFERKLHKLRDVVSDKREQKLLSLSSDDKQKLQQLKLVLDERLKRRTEIKAQLEALRKAKGSSGLDFSEALRTSDLIEKEKERLEQIEKSIFELEHQIEDLES